MPGKRFSREFRPIIPKVRFTQVLKEVMGVFSGEDEEKLLNLGICSDARTIFGFITDAEITLMLDSISKTKNILDSKRMRLSERDFIAFIISNSDFMSSIGEYGILKKREAKERYQLSRLERRKRFYRSREKRLLKSNKELREKLYSHFKNDSATIQKIKNREKLLSTSEGKKNIREQDYDDELKYIACN